MGITYTFTKKFQTSQKSPEKRDQLCKKILTLTIENNIHLLRRSCGTLVNDFDTNSVWGKKKMDRMGIDKSVLSYFIT